MRFKLKTEIKELTDEERSQVSEYEREIKRLKRKINDLEIGEENIRKCSMKYLRSMT